jgi:DNA-binding MarR family transcriptional regulator
MLVAIKHIGGVARPSDIARWIGRSPNSVCMIVDRMVKVGLLKRVRDRRDRRVVNVSITSKAGNSLQPAIRESWEFIKKITSPLSNEEKRDFIKEHDTLRYEIYRYLYPGENLDEMARNDDESHANLMERLVQYALRSTPKVKHQGD